MKKFEKSKLICPSLFILGTIFGLASCGESGTEDKPEDKEFIDYVSTGDVKLTLDYKGHNFFKDGIAEVELYTAIDGDTAHFNMVDFDGDLIKSRFYGVDTPESTGKIQEYGKAASNFTKEKLENADKNGTIVVSSPFFEYGAPSPDSTGTRYLSLIWINETKEHAPIEELQCLNLMLVQEGYSWVKGLNDIPEYVDTFTAAEQQARDLKLNLFSGEKDPLFNYGDYQDVSLLELKNAVAQSLTDPGYVNPYDGAKIRIQGTVAGYADHILYLQGFFDEETGSTVEGGEYAGVNIFTGMGSIPTKYTTTNTYIQLCGVAEDSENFGFQVTGVERWPSVSINLDEDDTQVIYTASEVLESVPEYAVHVFEYKPTELKDEQFECLFSPVKLTEEVIVTGGYKGEDSLTLYITDKDGNELDYNVYIPFVYRPDPSNPTLSYSTVEDFTGKSFMVNNAIYNFHKTKSGNINYQLIPTGSENFALVE